MPSSSLPTPPVVKAASAPRTRLGIAVWIAGAGLLAVLPMLLFATVLLYRQVAAEQAQGRAMLERRAAVAAAAVGHEIESVLAGLRVAARVPGVQGDSDTEAQAALSERLVAADPRLLAVALVPAAGQPSASALQPARGGLPPHVAVTLPLAGPDGPALQAAVRLETLGRRLGEQAWPAHWVGAVVDQQRVIIARSRDAARFVGTAATQQLQQGMASGRTVFTADTKEGAPSVVGVAPVPGTGWSVAVGQPLQELNDQVRASLASVLAAGLVCVLLTVGASLLVARHFSRELAAVVEAHGRGARGTRPEATIREVAELDQALAVAREQALAQLRERSEMLDVLAHEVRQPLNNASAALQAATTVLVAGGHQAATGSLTRARSVIAEVQASIDNTLAAATLLVRAQQIVRTDADVDALIGVAIADMPPQEAPRVQVRRETATRTASMDVSLMRLALRNLLFNALRASPAGSPVVVRVTDSDEPLALVLDVIDQGPGIDPALLPRLFEPVDGVRLARTEGRRKGLGLQIVRRVMDLHGGSVQVVETGPGGTTIRLVVAQSF